jgi:hypothetical protein
MDVHFFKHWDEGRKSPPRGGRNFSSPKTLSDNWLKEASLKYLPGGKFWHEYCFTK